MPYLRFGRSESIARKKGLEKRHISCQFLNLNSPLLDEDADLSVQRGMNSNFRKRATTSLLIKSCCDFIPLRTMYTIIRLYISRCNRNTDLHMKS